MKEKNEKRDINVIREEAYRKALERYGSWKTEHEGYNYQRLEDKRSQEILDLITSGILKDTPAPTRREVKERWVVIDADAIEVTTMLPDDLDILCTRFSPFVTWTGQKKELMMIDYERMDKYLLRNQENITDDEYFAYYYFDAILDLIQEDMSVFKPQLAKYLKNHEANMLIRAQKECIDIIKACQPLLKSVVRKGLLSDVIYELIDDCAIREEARAKLCCVKTRNKYICEIVAALDCFGIFKPEVNRRMLAQTLSQKMDSVSISSAEYYIKMLQGAKDSKLYLWVKDNIDDLKAHEYNPLQVLFGGIIK